jgi:hypothetical protein
VLGRGDAVVGQVGEQVPQHLLLEVELEGLLPAHDLARQPLVALRGEAEGHRRQVAVEAGPGHERHEQQVRQQVLEREPDGDEELERPGRDGVDELGDPKHERGHRGSFLHASSRG